MSELPSIEDYEDTIVEADAQSHYIVECDFSVLRSLMDKQDYGTSKQCEIFGASEFKGGKIIESGILDRLC